MPIQQTLEKIQWDIQNKNLGKARDRLHGLINSYPDNLELRKMLGDIYWQLQFPEMAGRYWYMEEEKNDNMVAACKRFEEQFNHDPMYMLFAIKYKGDLEEIEGTYAGETLIKLHTRAKEKHRFYEHFQNKRGGKFIYRKMNDNSNKNSGWGCILILCLFIGFAFIGVLYVIGVIH